MLRIAKAKYGTLVNRTEGLAAQACDDALAIGREGDVALLPRASLRDLDRAPLPIPDRAPYIPDPTQVYHAMHLSCVGAAPRMLAPPWLRVTRERATLHEVMEALDATMMDALRRRPASERARPSARAWLAEEMIASRIVAAADAGMLLTDIKPENVLLRRPAAHVATLLALTRPASHLPSRNRAQAGWWRERRRPSHYGRAARGQ